MNNTLDIDLSAITDEQRISLARCGYEMVRRLLEQFGAREAIEAVKRNHPYFTNRSKQ